MSYAYCVVTWSGKKRLAETLRSIPDTCERLLVVDSSQHLWPLSRAWNYAIDRLCIKEGYEAVVICNDDIVLRPDTGDLLVDGLLNRQHIDQRAHDDRKLLVVTAYNTRDLPDVGPRWGTGPDFSCFATSALLHQTVGPFDENFVPCYFEDNDCHYRLRLAGFEALSYAPYFHYGSQTIANDPERKAKVEETFEKNRVYYINKWGGDIGSEQFSRPFGRASA